MNNQHPSEWPLSHEGGLKIATRENGGGERCTRSPRIPLWMCEVLMASIHPPDPTAAGVIDRHGGHWHWDNGGTVSPFVPLSPFSLIPPFKLNQCLEISMHSPFLISFPLPSPPLLSFPLLSTSLTHFFFLFLFFFHPSISVLI